MHFTLPDVIINGHFKEFLSYIVSKNKGTSETPSH